MKTLCTWLVPVVLAFIAWISETETPGSSNSQTADYASEARVYHPDSDTPHCDFRLPRQTPSVPVIRLQHTARRIANTQRNQFEFVKNGKVILAGTKHFRQDISPNIEYPFAKPAHRLISLGRLII